MELVLEISTVVYSWATAFMFGWSEAFHWHYFAQAKKKLNQRYEHELWSAIRVLVHAPVLIFLFVQFGWFFLMAPVAMYTMYFYVHDGSYYYWRNELDGAYPKKWKDYSLTSTAKQTFDHSTRLSLFIYGILLFAMMFLSKYDGI